VGKGSRIESGMTDCVFCLWLGGGLRISVVGILLVCAALVAKLVDALDSGSSA
jgi:hypothetical protein